MRYAVDMRPSKGAKANTSKFSVITKYVARALTYTGLGQMFIWLSWCNYPFLQADILYLNSYIELVSITKNVGLLEVFYWQISSNITSFGSVWDSASAHPTKITSARCRVWVVKNGSDKNGLHKIYDESFSHVRSLAKLAF